MRSQSIAGVYTLPPVRCALTTAARSLAASSATQPASSQPHHPMPASWGIACCIKFYAHESATSCMISNKRARPSLVPRYERRAQAPTTTAAGHDGDLHSPRAFHHSRAAPRTRPCLATGSVMHRRVTARSMAHVPPPSMTCTASAPARPLLLHARPINGAADQSARESSPLRRTQS